MVSVADLAPTVQPLVTTVADQAARESGFLCRVRTLTDAAFVQALVCGWLDPPDASLSLLTQTSDRLHCASFPARTCPTLHPAGGGRSAPRPRPR